MNVGKSMKVKMSAEEFSLKKFIISEKRAKETKRETQKYICIYIYIEREREGERE